MKRFHFFLIFSLVIIARSGLCRTGPNDSESVRLSINEQDTLKENQILYNGRVWRNRYYRVRDNQFLFSSEFLPGTLSINGKSFKDLSIRYDILNDEIMTPANHGTILQLNKEMIDSFTINFKNKTYRFIKIQNDSLKGLNGYVNVLYKGESALYVKYKKEIELLAINGKYDLFVQTHRIYFLKDSIPYHINGKSDLFRVLNEDKAQIRSFIKKNKIVVSKKRPESFAPVIGYYDSIRH